MKSLTVSRPFTVWLLIILHVLLSIGALGGGLVFVLAPDGSLMHMPVSNMKNSPFPDYLIPALILVTFLGIYPLAVAYSLWARPDWGWPDAINPFKRYHWAWAASFSVGVILIIWISVQVQFIRPAFLHYVYWAWGIVTLLVTLLPGVRRYYHRHPR